MRDTTLSKFAIIALNTGDDTRILERNGFYHYKELQGVYKGKSEFSFLICFDTDSELDKILSLAATYNQESILVCESDRSTSLYYLNLTENNGDYVSDIVPIGQFTEVSESEAKKENSFTYDPNTDKYYTVIK